MGENCGVTVTCGAGQIGAFTYIGTVLSSSGNVMRYEDVSTTLIVAFTTAQATTQSWFANAQSYVMKYQTSVSAAAGAGFSTTLTCFNSQCSDNHVEATTITSYPTTVLTDADGSGSGTIPRYNENCYYHFQCPAECLPT